MHFRKCTGPLSCRNNNYSLFFSRYLQKGKLVDKASSPPKFISQFGQLIEIDWSKSREILTEHRKLLSIKLEDIGESVKELETLKYDRKELYLQPSLLYTSAVTLKNRHKILQECGCAEISLATLAKYIIIMNREVRIVKLHQLIPDEINVAQKLADSFADCNLVPQAEPDSTLLKTIRETVLNLYFAEKLKMSRTDIRKLWHSYSRVRNKSFFSISEMIEILTKELHFSVDRIVKNAFVLYADPPNVRQIIADIKSIGGDDIREILYRRPKIMMSPCDGIKKSIEHIIAYGIAESSIPRCIDVLTLGSDTVYERLQDMDQIDEFRVLKSNPRILRLIHYQTKARMRLEYLNQLKVKCASLHVLSSHTDAFMKYAKEGNDKGKGCDTVNYLASVFNKTSSEIREMISRHSNWCHVPTVTITQSYEFLISKLFTPDDIFPNLQILLYPIKRINEKLIYLQNDESYSDLHLDNISCVNITNQQMLALCLYLIELEFHFTGDGIWTDQDLHPVENFNSILPDFPDSWKKGYKYGTKPGSLNKLNDQNEVTLTG